MKRNVFNKICILVARVVIPANLVWVRFLFLITGKWKIKKSCVSIALSFCCSSFSKLHWKKAPSRNWIWNRALEIGKHCEWCPALLMHRPLQAGRTAAKDAFFFVCDIFNPALWLNLCGCCNSCNLQSCPPLTSGHEGGVRRAEAESRSGRERRQGGQTRAPPHLPDRAVELVS